MTEGKTFTVTEQLNSEEDFNALQEVTAELEQAEADNIMLIGRIEELEAKLAKAVEALRFYGTEANYDGAYVPDLCGCCGSWFEPKIHRDGEDSGDLARTTLAELKGQDDE